MKRMLINTIIALVLLAIPVLVCTEVLLPSLVDEQSYLAASIDKEKRLRETTPPRVIFIGGSNASFGIDSRAIGAQLGITPVNMGLHAGLGLYFMLNETAAGVKKGDYVVLSLEHFLGKGQLRLQALLVAKNPAAIQYLHLSPLDYIRIYVFKFQIFLRLRFYGGESLNAIYVRHGFNTAGDLESHMKIPYGEMGPPKLDVQFSTRDYNEETAAINSFIDHCKSVGASVCFVPPGFPETTYNLNKVVIEESLADLRSQLHCQVLGNPTDFLYGDDQILDALYHLREQARTDRAQKTAGLIEEWIRTGAQ